MNSAPFVISGFGELDARQRERAVRANQLFEKIFEQRGVKVLDWLSFPAWQSYVQGRTDAPELETKAKLEMEGLGRTFGKYVVVKEEEPSSVQESRTVLERARKANRIYKKVCKEVGLTLCFFSDFDAWREYVRGKIEEDKFYERAKSEAEKIMAKAGEN